MESVTGYEQEQTVSQADIEAIPHTDILKMTPEESGEKLQQLQAIEDLTPKVRDLITSATGVRGTEQIDKTVAALRRLGVFGTEAGVPDPTFGGDQLKGLSLTDKAGFTFNFEKNLETLREHKRDDTEQEFTDWLDSGLTAGASSANRLVELTALAVANGMLKGEFHKGDKSTPAHLELHAPDDIFRARKEALTAKVDSVMGGEPGDHERFFRDVAAAREHAAEQARQAAAHESQVHRAREAAEAKAAKDREAAAKAEMDRLYRTPNALGGYAEDMEKAQREKVQEHSARLGRDLLDPAQAEVQAHREDHESSLIAGDETLQRLANEAAKADNPKIKAELEQRVKSYRDELKKAAETIDRQAAKLAGDVQIAAGKHETEHRLDRTAPHAEFNARVNREVLGLLEEPFLQVNKGGLFHRKAGRGPRVQESYFRHPDNPYLIVVERRAQKNGELISQTTFTTERPTRDKGHGRILPPRGFNVRMELVRQQDRLSSGYKPTIGDYLPSGAGRVDLRSDRGGTLPSRQRRRNGGLLFWLLGERI